jgi:ribosomal protein S18 acetylase RimI-like enzyme
LADLDGLTELERNFPSDLISRRSFRHLLTRGHADIRVFSAEGRIVGNVVTLYRRNSARARLYSLVVHADYRGRSIAHELILTAEQAARQRACSILSLEVCPRNKPALCLYNKLGYTIERRIADYYADHRPALRLSKQLTPPDI